MSWIVPNSPGDTLQLLEDRDLINFNKPSESTLRTKSLGRDDHGGGIKFPADGQTDREWVGFLEDYAAIKKERYANASDIPKNASIRTWRTGHHLRIKDLSTALRGRGIAWAFCGAINSLTNGYQSPNSVVPDIVTHFSGYFGPRSHHTGGAQVGRADGSVGFLSSSTDQGICQALHSCNGGEIASEN